MCRLDGKIALITGAASGQGEATARLFVKKGATVILSDINESLGRETAEKIAQEENGETHFVHHDISLPESWDKVIRFIEERYNRLDILVNNAGVPSRYPLQQLTEDEWREAIDINATGVFLGIKKSLHLLKRSKNASIVNNSSIWSLVGSGGAASYHAAKGAVRMLSKTVAVELAPFGIRVNCVHPGLIRTPMTESLIIDENELKSRVGPMGRPGEPYEVANAILFLASEQSSYITGIDLPVDGGYTAR